MDPKTQSEMMEDASSPSERGFIADDQTDAEAREELERNDDESPSVEDYENK